VTAVVERAGLSMPPAALQRELQALGVTICAEGGEKLLRR
jgi:hypothetical protein